jgi:pSer/pThr/pTyr-binding forkhead associated (FHA) protein
VRVGFLFLTGDRSGQTAIVDGPYATLGRHPLCTVAFDGDQDLDVSSRHAAVFREGELFILRDLGSTNGTFVNGQRLWADHILANEDVLQFGHRGPKLRVTLTPDESLPYQPAVPSPTQFSTIPPRRTKEDTAPVSPHHQPASNATPVRREPARRRRGLRLTLLVLGALLAGLAIGMVWLRSGAWG